MSLIWYIQSSPEVWTGEWEMIELILRKKEEVNEGGRSVMVIQEEPIFSFRESCTFEKARETIKKIFSQCNMVNAFIKAGILNE